MNEKGKNISLLNLKDLANEYKSDNMKSGCSIAEIEQYMEPIDDFFEWLKTHVKTTAV